MCPYSSLKISWSNKWYHLLSSFIYWGLRGGGATRYYKSLGFVCPVKWSSALLWLCLKCSHLCLQVQVLRLLSTMAQRKDLLYDIMNCEVRATLETLWESFVLESETGNVQLLWELTKREAYSLHAAWGLQLYGTLANSSWVMHSSWLQSNQNLIIWE